MSVRIQEKNEYNKKQNKHYTQVLKYESNKIKINEFDKGMKNKNPKQIDC